jgi:hypothetical protein
VIFQLGQRQICVLDPNERTVALLAKGRWPIVTMRKGQENKEVLHADVAKAPASTQQNSAQHPASAPPAKRTPKPDGKKKYEEFAAAIKSYPYEAPQVRKDGIVQNYPKLELGMSKDRIAELIGDPDYSRLVGGL